MKGFSTRNLKYMRALAETYRDEQFVQQAVAQIPWGHNVRILDYVKSPAEREFYIHKTIENGWMIISGKNSIPATRTHPFLPL